MTTPSLAEGGPVRNALLTLATQLKRIDTIASNQSTIQTKTPRMPQTKITQKYEVMSPLSPVPRVKSSSNTETPLRVMKPTIPEVALQQPSNLPNNMRFQNSIQHRYPLKS